MRSDYILYSIAVLFFVVTAVSFVIVNEESSRNMYVVSTVVAGIAFASAGFLLRPKKAATILQAPQPTVSAQASAEQTPAAQPVPQPVAIEVPSAIVPKTETPIAEKLTVETPLAESPPAPVVLMETAIPTPAILAATPAVNAPVSTPTAETPSNSLGNLTQIRGINAKRAEQLKANGVSNLQELAKASPAELSAKLEVSEKIVKMWIGSAKKLAN